MKRYTHTATARRKIRREKWRPLPDDDFRGLATGYIRRLADQAFVLGITLLILAVPAVLAPIVWWPWGWALVPVGLLIGWAGANSLCFCVRALEAADQRRGKP